MSAHSGVRLLTLAVLLLVSPAAVIAQSVVGVLGIASEVAPIERRLQDSREVAVRGYVFRAGTLHGHHVVVGRSGIGKVNAAIVATLLIREFNPSAILFSGTAGAIDPDLHLGDVVIGVTVAQHDAGVHTPEGIQRRGIRNALTGDLDPLLVPAPEGLLAVARRSANGLPLPPVRTPDGQGRTPRIVEGVIVTGDVFLSDVVLRGVLRKTLGATAVEMEGAAVVQVCRQFGVSCLVVRSITDRADGHAEVSYKEFLATASENAATLVAATIARLEDPPEQRAQTWGADVNGLRLAAWTTPATGKLFVAVRNFSRAEVCYCEPHASNIKVHARKDSASPWLELAIKSAPAVLVADCPVITLKPGDQTPSNRPMSLDLRNYRFPEDWAGTADVKAVQPTVTCTRDKYDTWQLESPAVRISLRQ